MTVEVTRPTTAVTLVGTGSFDPDGGPVTHEWTGPFNGVAVSDGQQVKLRQAGSYDSSVSRKGELTIEGPDATLSVTCTDASGNSSTASAVLDL